MAYQDMEQLGGVTGGGAGVDVMTATAGGLVANGGGTVAQRLMASGFRVEALRTNGVLLPREWEYFDNVVVDIIRQNLVAVKEIMSRGLIYNLPNALGVMTLEWQQVLDDLEDAEITMSGLNEATKDRQQYGTLTMPIPIIHKEFFYNVRFLEAARRAGRRVDTVHAEVATRKVAERVEKLLFSGLTIAGGTIYGLMTHPNRNTGSVSAGWATATGAQIVTDVIAMMTIMAQKVMSGPFVLFIPLTVAAHLGDDYKANSDKTILERLMAIPGLTKIVTTSYLTGNNVLLVQMTSDVVQMVDGIQPTMVEWESKGGFEFNFKIIAILLPRIRASGNGFSGIVHFS